MLRVGSRGSAVKALQRKLGITADGIFGPKTRAAVVAYQRKHGLSVDGIAGPQTLGSLGLAGGSRSSAPAAPAKPKIDERTMAAKYGMALAVINSDKSLRKVFDGAIREGWTTEEFVARARETSWYKNNSESARQALILQKADPATWKQRVAATRASLGAMAQGMGAPIPSATMQQLAEQATTFGWNEDQIRATLSNYIKWTGDGQLYGQAAQWETQLRDFAQSMGVRLSDNWVLSNVKDAARSQGATIEGSMDKLRRYAISAFPHLADRFEAGETLEEIAAPYRQSMAQLLELNPEQLDMFDPTIRSALSGKDDKGKPAMKSLWQFENDLRKDQRWLGTDNARESVMGVARQVLTDFGLAV